MLGISISISVGSSYLSTAPWTPSDITTRAWYDAADASTITANGSGAVGVWGDKSGNDYNLEQSSGANQLATGTRTINGLNVLDSPSQGFMEKTSFPIPASGNVCFFMVGIVDTVDNNADSIFSCDATNDFQVDANANGQFDGRIRSSNIGASDTLTYTGGPFTGASIFGNTFDFDGGNMYGYVDGTERATQAYTAKLSSSMILRVLKNRASNQNVDGAVGEFIIAEDCTVETRQLIEGYLAHKWGLTSSLPSDHPYKYDGRLFGYPLLWSPNEINAALWLDAKDASTITANGSGEVSAWNDKSGNDNHLIQTSASLQPLTDNRTINGVNAIDFDNTSKFLQGENASDWNFLHNPNGSAMFLVSLIDTPTDTSPKYYLRTRINNTGIQHYTRKVSDKANNRAFLFENFVTTGIFSTNVYQSDYDVPKIINFEHGIDRENNFGSFIDGVQDLNQDYNSNPIGNFDCDVPLQVGRNVTQAIGTFLCLDYIPSTETRQKIEGYLAHEFEMTSTLPAEHPYKTERPTV